MPTGLIVILSMLAQSPALPPGWMVYTPKAGGFSIAMPPKPTVKTVSQEGKAGAVEVLDVSGQAEGCLYRVERTMMPRPFGKANEQGALDAICKSVAAKTALKAQQAIEVEGHPGLDLLVEAPLKPGAKPSKIAMRLFVVDRDLYQIRVFAIAPGSEPKRVADFFDSFRLAPEDKK